MNLNLLYLVKIVKQNSFHFHIFLIVPVALSTDDEGVARSDITQEYLRAEQTYGFSYTELKHMARDSVEHAFLPGLLEAARNPKIVRQLQRSFDRVARRTDRSTLRVGGSC